MGSGEKRCLSVVSYHKRVAWSSEPAGLRPGSHLGMLIPQVCARLSDARKTPVAAGFASGDAHSSSLCKADIPEKVLDRGSILLYNGCMVSVPHTYDTGTIRSVHVTEQSRARDGPVVAPWWLCLGHGEATGEITPIRCRAGERCPLSVM